MPPGAGQSDEESETSDDGKKPRRSLKQRLALSALATVIFISLAGIGAAAWGIHTLGRVERIGDVALDQVVDGDPINYLLIGSDEREAGSDLTQKLADSIVLFRIDPEEETAAVLTFPRDLMVPLAEDGEFDPTSEPRQINHAYASSNGRDDLAETIRANFGISIHHFVEIDMEGFETLINSVGGIDVYVDRAIHDPKTGLNIEETGCVNLDGATALLFVRSRDIHTMGDTGWERADLTADLGRGTRQREFIQQALGKALREAPTNPNQLRQSIESLADTVAIDDTLRLSDLSGLVNAFRDLDPNDTESFFTQPLPVQEDPNDANRVVLLDVQAEPILNVFRGLPPDEVSPRAIDLTVLNGSGEADQATNVAGAFQELGFRIGEVGDTQEAPATTTIYHGPGEENLGMRVARHVTGSVWVQEREGLSTGEVEVVTGADFESLHETPTDPESMPDTAPPAAAGEEQGEGGEMETAEATSEGAATEGDSPDNEESVADQSAPATSEPPAEDNTYSVGAGGSCA
jgi:LCP family protein required for cell wall assembly